MEIKIKLSLIKKIAKEHFVVSSANYYSLPEMSGILVEVFDNRVTFETSNEFISLFTEINKGIDLSIESIGKFLIKGKMFFDVVSKLSGNYITLKIIEKNHLLIQDENSDFELNLFDEGQIEPQTYSIENKNEFTIESSVFKKTLDKAIVACNDKNPKRILQGVNIKGFNGKISFIATDLSRVIVDEFPLVINNSFSIVIAGRVIKEILKVIDDSEVLKINFNEGFLTIRTITKIIKISLIEGVYPEVKNYFPKEAKFKLVAKKQELVSTLEKAMVLTQNKPNENYSTKMTIEHGELTFEIREMEIGNNIVKLKNIVWEGEPFFQISFNPKFLLEMARSIDSEQIYIDFNDPEKPFVVYSIDNVDYQLLILPFRRQ